MNQASNTFLKGLSTDLHPLATDNQTYTDALNATEITYNGNEQMMQNDMGNTKIQDSKTGNIMGLRQGFIPVGLKEHGGIMYIASVKKGKDGNEIGELGTIPSPVMRFNDPITYIVNRNQNAQLDAFPDYPSELIKLTTSKVHVGERFVVAMQPNDDTKQIKVNYFTLNDLSKVDPNPLTYDLITNCNSKGLYKVALYSQTDDQIFDLSETIELNNEYV